MKRNSKADARGAPNGAFARPVDTALRPGLSVLAVSLSALSAVVYFLSSNGVRNHLRWLAHAAWKLLHG
jgi:hypothetical protein